MINQIRVIHDSDYARRGLRPYAENLGTQVDDLLQVNQGIPVSATAYISRKAYEAAEPEDYVPIADARALAGSGRISLPKRLIQLA